MFRYFLLASLFLSGMFLSACSPKNGSAPKSSSPQEIEMETPIEMEAQVVTEKDNKTAQETTVKNTEARDALTEAERLETVNIDEANALKAETAKQVQISKSAADAKKAAVQAKVLDDERTKVAQAEALAQEKAIIARTKKAETARKALKQQVQEQQVQEKTKAAAAMLAETEQQASAQQVAELRKLEVAAQQQAELEAKKEALKDRVIAQGTFTKKKKSINGTWSINMKDGKRYLQFDDGFKTKWAADLQIFLSPKSIAQANNKNAGENVYRLAPLTSKKGAQTYIIPADVDLDIYNSILIHCEEYELLWGGTDIR